MTRNQIDAARAREDARANKAREAENYRSNTAREAETYRSNKANEKISRQGNKIKSRANDISEAKYQQEAKTARRGQNAQFLGSMINTGAGLVSNAQNQVGGLAKALIPMLLGGAQHPEWYTKNPEMADGVGRYPTNYPAGVPYRSKSGNLTNGLRYPNSEGYLMVARFQPTFGAASDFSSALNVASKKIYSFVRHANSGSSNYEHQDLTLNMMCLDSIYMFISDLARLYGTVRLYQAENRSIPAAILKAYGFSNQDELLIQMGPLYNAILALIDRCSLFIQPGDMALTARRLWLTSNILVNPERPWAEMYMYMPEGGYEFVISNENDAGSAVYTRNWIDCDTIEKRIKYINRLIDQLAAQEDSAIMAGDIKKAYGDNVLSLSPIPIDYKPGFVTDPNALEQFANIVISPIRLTGYVQDVAEGSLLHQESINSSYDSEIKLYSETNGDPWMVRTWEPDIDAPTMISRTRGMFTIKGNTLSEAKLTSFGSELITEILVYYSTSTYNSNTIRESNFLTFREYELVEGNYNGGGLFILGELSRISHFEYAPMMRFFLKETSTDTDFINTFQSMYTFGDNHYYALVPSVGIEQMNYVAINSLLYAPGMK